MILDNAVAIAVNNQDVVKISIDGQLVWEKQYFGSISMQSTVGERQFSSLQEVREYIELYSDQLTTIALSGTPDAYDTNMSGLFEDCVNATSIDLSEFNPFLVNDVSNLFKGCSSLQTVDLCTFRTSNSTLTDGMFEGCLAVDVAYAKSQEDCDRLNTSIGKEANVTFIVKPLQMSINGRPAEEYASFAIAKEFISTNKATLTSVTISGNPSETSFSLNSLFYRAPVLERVNLLGLNVDRVTTATVVVDGCYVLSELLLPDFRLGNLIQIEHMFISSRSLEQIDLSNLNTENADRMDSLFNSCISLRNLDLRGFNTNKVISMYAMFYNCQALTELDLSSFDFTSGIDLESMFSKCLNLATVYLKTQAYCDLLKSANTGAPATVEFIVKA